MLCPFKVIANLVIYISLIGLIKKRMLNEYGAILMIILNKIIYFAIVFISFI